MATPLVECRQVGVRIGDAQILRDLDLSVLPGDVVGISGANGSGKTTLLRMVATLVQPTAGTAVVLGTDLTSQERFGVRPRIGLIGHTPALFPQLTLAENTDFVARVGGHGGERVAEVLDTVGLTGARNRRVEQCSNGMQRRAEFARILLTEPDLVLLDEAHAGLDPQAADLVTLIVKTTQARNGAAVLVSHERDRIAPLLSTAHELSGGRLEEA